MSRNRILLATAGIMFSLFLASMESAVVATAMPAKNRLVEWFC
jgi:hypothetical protein